MPKDLTALFHHNPPRDPGLAHRIFVNRSSYEIPTLLARTVESETSDYVHAVHGGSRVGKSHLALQFLQLVPRAHWHVFSVHADEGKLVRLVLQDVYSLVRNEVLSIENPIDLEEEGVSSRPILEDAKEFIRRIDGLLTDRHNRVTSRISVTAEDSLGLKLLGKIFGMSYQDRLGVGESMEIVVEHLSDYQLLDSIGELVEVLRISTGKRCLIYVDDVDLMDQGTPEGGEEATLLLRLLARLTEMPGAVVVASLRSRAMATGDKRFYDSLAVEPLGDKDLRELHERHIEEFHEKEAVFSSPCVGHLVELAAGRPGNFLRTCRRFMDWGMRKGLLGKRKLNTGDLKDFVIEEIVLLQAMPVLKGHVSKIVSAAKAVQLQLRLELSDRDLEQLVPLVEEPAIAGSSIYEINGFVARTVRGISDVDTQED